MKRIDFKDIYPVYVKHFRKNTLHNKTLDNICAYFCAKIETHPFAEYINIFDHYTHTTRIEGCLIDDNIIAAKNIIFCFGKKLLDPEILAVRPRSIGVCETTEHFVISFLEAPMPALTETMTSWAVGLLDNGN